MMKRILLLLGLFLLCGCSTPQSEQRYPDVKVSRLLRVIDGDTFRCDIDEHSAIAGKNISIRLRGINTPELRSRNPEERKSANLEKQRLFDLLNNARVIELRNIDRDKYFRIDADVYIDGEPLLPKLNQQYLTGAQK
jgi:nuclease (SNase domain protein)